MTSCSCVSLCSYPGRLQDRTLPDMDGLQLISAIRTDARYMAIPVIGQLN